MAGIKYWDLLQGYNIFHYIPVCMHVYLDYSGGGGRGSPSNQPPPHPQYMLTYSYKETHLTRNNTKEHATTHNNSRQFKGSKKSWPPQNVPRNGS